MSALPSTYLVNKVNDAIYKGTAMSIGSSRYLALYSTDPTAAGTGTEASGGSYARQLISFANSAGGVSTSSALITFSGLSAGTYPYYGVLSAATAGNLIVYGALPAPISANTGDDVTIPSGDIDFNLAGS